MKNCPERSAKVATCSSCIVNLFTPDNTIFFAISTPNGPNPDRNTLEFDCLLTASSPIAPMYLDHLSLTASS